MIRNFMNRLYLFTKLSSPLFQIGLRDFYSSSLLLGFLRAAHSSNLVVWGKWEVIACLKKQRSQVKADQLRLDSLRNEGKKTQRCSARA